MTIDLLPGHGIRPPAPLPELAFGLGKADVLRLLAPHGDALPDGLSETFVCGSAWSLGFALPGLGVTLCTPGADRFESGRPDPDRFGTVFVTLNPHDERPPCPVGLYGVDVFGWPAHEVVEALRAAGLALPNPDHGTVRHGPLRLSCRGRAPRPPAPGRKARHEAPFTFDSVSLSAADRPTPDTR